MPQITTQTHVNKTNLIQRFHERVKDIVQAYTEWNYYTGVFDTNVGYIINNSTAWGGAYNRGVYGDAIQNSVSATDFLNTLRGNSVSGSIVETLKHFMRLYTYTHRVTIWNTGNIGPANYNGTVRLTDVLPEVTNAISVDVDNAASTNNIINGKVASATNLENFIQACQNAWFNRAYHVTPENFYYYYCHSSCHANHGSHGSRGRR